MKKFTFLIAVLAGFLFVSVCDAQTSMIVTVAGGNSGGSSIGDGLVATNPSVILSGTRGVCTDPAGNIYIADAGNNRVRKVNAITGIINTIAGNGTSGFTGDGGQATDAEMNTILGVCLDNAGNLYIVDQGNNRIRKVDASTGIINTVAGGGSSSANGIIATSAKVNTDYVYVDAPGNVYFTDGNYIRKVDVKTGLVNSITAGGTAGYSGDGGPATNAKTNGPFGITGDVHGNIYFTDLNNYRVRKIDPSGIISTVAGNGTFGSSGDGGSALSAQLYNPLGIGVDGEGNIYIAAGNIVFGSYIKKVNSATGIISTITGNYGARPASYDTIGAPATNENIIAYHIYTDAFGNTYFSTGSLIEKVTNTSSAVSFTADSFSVNVNYLCNGPEVTVVTHRYAPGMSIKTYYGDGTNDTAIIINGFGTGYAVINHTYANTGTYTVKQTLYSGLSPVDSITFSNPYSFCRTLPVNFYYDTNGDCIKDGTEQYMISPVSTGVYSNGTLLSTISTTSGFYYNAYGNPGDIFTFKLTSLPGNLNASCLPLNTWHDTIQSSIVNYTPNYIGFNCSSSTNFDLYEYVSVLCGRHAAGVNMIVYNAYCTAENATLTMQISDKYVFIDSRPSPTSVSANTISWDFAGLSVVDWIPVYISVSFDKASSYLTLGDTVNSNFLISPLTGDVNTGNNYIVRVDTVKSSFDPNEMSVSPSGYISTGTKLEYAINFENTGNDTAFNIYVMDTLSDYVDAQTLNIEASSAVMFTTMLNDNGHKIERFDFPNINLLDSSHHNECNGLVMFNIKTKNGLSDGTTIFNHAGIFFDTNPVVMTNTVEDIIGIPTKVPVIKNTSNVQIYPNPTTDELTIKMDNAAYNTYTISNSIGQLMLQNKISATQTNVSVKALPAGLYYISLRGDNGTKVMKFVKM